ncbi:hypothetical protein O181_073301 [Austropuccinia psidii MF-1]|uniref:Reverse transcriptase Ty1/copia-type domain-containing protein n=1 Tax=Austropuccinia psidii MF-1 TaxID=1389203 RepID=A0A9Q3FAU5_9BASI|nr:hypothetical protein [Austropuccinia psidii MF-1]
MVGEASAMAAFILDRTPVSTLDFIAPLSILCMLVGIQEGHHDYRLFDPKTNSIYISHDCIFKNEEDFWPSHSSCLPTFVQEPLLLPSTSPFNTFSNIPNVADKPESVLFIPEENPSVDASINPQATPIRGATSPPPNLQIPFEADSSIPAFSEQPSSTGGNNNYLPKGWTYNVVPVEAPQNVDSSISSSNILTGGRLRRPPSRFAGAVINKAPVSFKEAMASTNSDAWLVAVQNEFSSLEHHGVLEEVVFRDGLRLLDTTWVFREKTDSLGNVIERKARLCVCGFLQVEDLDFHKTFSPTGRLSTLCFLLGYCADHDFDLHQMDVKTAFLHGNLDKSLFIWLPEGYKSLQSKYVCLKLRKSLYGLKHEN